MPRPLVEDPHALPDVSAMAMITEVDDGLWRWAASTPVIMSWTSAAGSWGATTGHVVSIEAVGGSS